MAEYVDFHYMPLEGKITGKQVLKQTEDAINDLGQHVYEIDIDDEKIQEAIDTSNQAIETAEEALAVVTTNRAVWYNSVTELREAIIDNGIVAAIKGYAFAGDEGQAFYVVREKKSGDVDDGKTIIFLDAGNVAEIIANTGITNMFDFDEDGYLSQIVDGDISNQYGEKKRLASYEGQQEIVEAFNDVINASLDIKGNSESARNSAEIAKQASDSLIQYLDTRESITAPIVDATLTISGAAADAEVTGDRIEIGTGIVPLSMTSGKYVKTDVDPVDITDIRNYSIFQYCIETCVEGDGFIVNGTGTTAARLWTFIQADGTVISRSSQTASETNLVLIAPANSAYLIINDNTGSTSYKGKTVPTLDAELSSVETVVESNKNKIDKLIVPNNYTEIDVGQYTNYTLLKPDGTTQSSTGSAYVVTDYVDISQYYGLRVTASMNYGYSLYCFYDSNHVFISGLTSASGSARTYLTNALVSIPVNAKYIRFGSYTSVSVFGAENIQSFAYLKGKKWACMGDSLTAVNEATTMHYYEYISEATGVTPINMGLGGSGYKKRDDENKAFYQRILNVDPTIDFCTVFGSGNDMSFASSFGTYTDTTTDTVAGCVNTFLDNYFSICVTQPIGIIAPTPWYAYPTTTPNNNMERYVELLRQIAQYRGVPFLDLYHESNLRPENQANRDACFYSGSLDGHGDGTHPNELGHKIISSKIREFINKLVL